MRPACEAIRTQLQGVLRNARIVFAGPRGSDADALSWHQDVKVVSITNPTTILHNAGCLEELVGRRVEVNGYSWDDDFSEEALELRARLDSLCSKPVILVPYRPSRIISDIWLRLWGTTVEYAGVFHRVQQALEFKPWVEQELRRAGVPIIEWHYIRSPADILNAGPLAFPIVVRRSRGSGGRSCELLRTWEELERFVSVSETEGLWGWSEYLSPSMPINVNATVFPGGRVSFHPSSTQLVGIEVCTDRPLVYCGNDFYAIKCLQGRVLADVEEIVRVIGRWIEKKGYLGAFGVDLLVVGESVLFVEVNARFQGSSRMAASLDAQNGRSDQYMTHIAALSGIELERDWSLGEVVARQAAESQLSLYCKEKGLSNVGSYTCGEGIRIRATPSSRVSVDPGGLICITEFDRQVTTDGWTLDPTVARTLEEVREQLEAGEVGGHTTTGLRGGSRPGG